MNKKRTWSRFLLALVTLGALAYTLPTLLGPDNLPKWYTSIFSKTLNYGLDIQGGLELRFAVDYKLAIRDNSNRLRDTISTRLAEELARKEGKQPDAMSREDLQPYRNKITTELLDYGTIKVTFPSTDDKDLLDQDFLDLHASQYVVASSDGPTITITMPEDKIAEVRDNAVAETLSVIRKRIDAFGLVEPDVRKNGESEIDIQLPGVDKEHMDLVRERLGQTAALSFRMVDTTTDFFADKQAAIDAYKAANPSKARTLELRDDPSFGRKTIAAQSKAELVSFIKTLTVPDDHTIGFELVEASSGGVVEEAYWKTLYVYAKVELSGDYLTRAMVLTAPDTGWYVSLDFNSEGAEIFGDLTEANVDGYLAIMLDDDINSAPRIEEPIRGGRARITLGGNRPPNEQLSEANSLVTVLNHGAYKAPVHKIHDHEVGPSLGADSIHAGMIALSVGALLVVLFILIYYKTAGIIAVSTLALNMIFILATLINFDAALTLPGMAGIILTIGMAVDANVLIFERIREELRGGRSFKAATEAGFERAFWTIFDANVTTALAAIILINFTSGPIYGFAVVLLTGIVFSVFTAYFVGKLVFESILERGRGRQISI
jgi:preprotein translocase subunit SecD